MTDEFYESSMEGQGIKNRESMPEANKKRINTNASKDNFEGISGIQEEKKKQDVSDFHLARNVS